MADDQKPGEHERGFLKLHPRLRGPVRFLLTVLATLILGVAIERIGEATAKDRAAATAAFARVQHDAVRALGALEPSTAFELFMASAGTTPEDTARMVHQSKERWARHDIPFGSLPEDNPANYVSSIERETGVTLGHWGHGSGSTNSVTPATPVAALADVVWHLLTKGEIIARVMVLGQLVLGAALTAFAAHWLGRRGWGMGAGIWTAALFSVSTVLLASGTAYAMGFLITTSQALLGGVGHLAGVSVGLGTVTSCCAAFFKKSVEVTLDKRVEQVLEKI